MKKILLAFTLVIIFSVGCGSETSESAGKYDVTFVSCNSNTDGVLSRSMYYVVENHTGVVYLYNPESHTCTLLVDESGNPATAKRMEIGGEK